MYQKGSFVSWYFKYCILFTDLLKVYENINLIFKQFLIYLIHRNLKKNKFHFEGANFQTTFIKSPDKYTWDWHYHAHSVDAEMPRRTKTKLKSLISPMFWYTLYFQLMLRRNVINLAQLRSQPSFPEFVDWLIRQIIYFNIIQVLPHPYPHKWIDEKSRSEIWKFRINATPWISQYVLAWNFRRKKTCKFLSCTLSITTVIHIAVNT